MSFPFYKQLNAMNCGPTCLRMVAKYYGRHFNTGGIKSAMLDIQSYLTNFLLDKHGKIIQINIKPYELDIFLKTN